jgi:hypothetical protein
LACSTHVRRCSRGKLIGAADLAACCRQINGWTLGDIPHLKMGGGRLPQAGARAPISRMGLAICAYGWPLMVTA